MNKLRIACAIALGNLTYFANEKKAQAVEFFLPNALTPAPEVKDGKEQPHWVQVSPFGDFANGNNGKRVIQRFAKEDAETIANAFNAGNGKVTGQPFGVPFYIGHPDHPAFRSQPGHSDPKSYGRGKQMEVRHDPACGLCNTFANATGDAEASPCPTHGLFVRVDWNEEGKKLIANESFHGHSVNWGAIPAGKENGMPVYRPVTVKSIGLTNQPNIPVKPASLANAGDGDGDESISEKSPAPPFIKLAAGFKEDDTKTIGECLEALKTAKPVAAANSLDLDSVLDFVLLGNAKDDDEGKAFIAKLHEKLGTDPKGGTAAIEAALEKKLPDADAVAKVREARKVSDKASAAHSEAYNKLHAQMANERKAVVTVLVKAGKVSIKDAPAVMTELANIAADQFEAKILSYGNSGARSTGLAAVNFLPDKDEGERQQKILQLMNTREQEKPQESYGDRFTFVANSDAGKPLFAQMKKAGADDDE
jgi:hypothetical protein